MKKKSALLVALLSAALVVSSCTLQPDSSSNSVADDSTPSESVGGDSTGPSVGGDSTGSSVGGDSTQESVDKSALDAMIAEVEATYGTNSSYTSASYEALMNALEAAKIVSADADATQADVDAALSDLESAIVNLKEIVATQELFEEAINKDYSNSTIECEIVTEGGEGESYYFTIYNQDGYNVVYYTFDSQAYYEYFYDYNGVSYEYFSDTVNGVEKEAWINDGWEGISYDIRNIYFHWKQLQQLDPTKITIVDTTYYYYPTEEGDDYLLTAEEILFSSTNMSIPAALDILGVSITTDDDNNIKSIIGHYDEDGNNYVRMSFYDVGLTTFITNPPAAPTEETIMTYYEFYETERHIHQPVTSVTLSHAATAKESYLPEEEFSLYLDVTGAEGFDKSKDFDTYYIENHIDDETIIDVGWGYDDPDRPDSEVLVVTPLKEGTAHFYVTYQNQYGDKDIITSNTITVVVRKAQSTITDPQVYDMTFIGMEPSSISANQAISAVNSLNNKKPYTVSGDFLHLSDLSLSQNDDFPTSGYAILFDPANNATMNQSEDSNLEFDFGQQEVSAISFELGLYWNADYGRLSYLSTFKIQTKASTEGAEWVDAQDLTSFVKENMTETHTTLVEAEFAPTSHVRIVADSSMLGNSIRPAIVNVDFFANSECTDYTIPDPVALESVSLNESYSVRAGETITVNAIPNPTNATDVTYSYAVADTTIATVEGNVITGVSQGSTTITVTATQGTTELTATATLTVEKAYVHLTGVSFAQDALSVEHDYSTEYSVPEVTILPADAEDVTISYSCSDTTVASVDSSTGTITTYKAGTATITVTATQGELSFSDTLELTVTVTLPTEIDADLVGSRFYGSYSSGGIIDLTIVDSTTITLIYDGTEYNGYFYEATSKTSFEFYTDNTEFITITKVSADSVWVSSTDLGISYDAWSDEPISKFVTETGISISQTDFSLEVGQTKQLSATVTPYGASIKTYTWSSSNDVVATVSADGLVSAVGAGEATITATSQSGLTATVKVTVTEPTPVDPTEVVVPADYRGTWYSSYYYDEYYYYYYGLTFTISADGKSATIEFEDGITSAVELTLSKVEEVSSGYYNLTFLDADGGECLFQIESSFAYITYAVGDYSFTYDSGYGSAPLELI